MKISKLVELLNHVKEIRGDVEVRLDKDGSWEDVTELTYHEYFVLENLMNTYPFVVIEGE